MRLVALTLVLAACGTGTEADRLGIAATCDVDDDCPEVDGVELSCLTEFTAGYCGLSGCTGNDECPEGSVCVDEGTETYCFRACTEKFECNANRPIDVEANCSANITFVDADTPGKACVPPSAG